LKVQQCENFWPLVFSFSKISSFFDFQRKHGLEPTRCFKNLRPNLVYRCVAAGVLASELLNLLLLVLPFLAGVDSAAGYILVADVFADAAVPTVGGILPAAGALVAVGAFAADAVSAVAGILDAAGIHAMAHFLTAASLLAVADIKTKIFI
jgi:hypothetical protein